MPAVEGSQKVAAGLAAAAVVVGGGIVKFGDDIGRSVFRNTDDVTRSLGSGSDSPPIGGGVLGGGSIGSATHAGASQVESQVDAFVTQVADGIFTTQESAREAGLTVACDVLYIAYTELRLPTEREWVDIGVGAVVGAAVDAPVGSAGWLQLEGVKDAVGDAVSDAQGYVDDTEAESVADTLACEWA